MEKILVQSSQGPYQIIFSSYHSIKDKIQEYKPSNIFILCNQIIADLYLRKLQEELLEFKVNSYILPEKEEAKTLDVIQDATTQMLAFGCDGNTLLIAFGGGTVGDVTGLLSSLYHRGIKYINIPTTLLSMVDSAIGGKTAVNHPKAKNILGTYYSPKSLIIDINILESLPEKIFNSAFSEVIKYAILFDKNFLNFLSENYLGLKKRDPVLLLKVIHQCCLYKTNIVQEDERDNSKRKLLNLGHTLGHAVEQVSNYSILHGDAVALGIVFACIISKLHGKLPRETIEIVKSLLIKFDLPVQLHRNLATQKLIDAMLHDKKNGNGEINMILLQDFGFGELANNVSLDTISKAITIQREI